ncbi:unnamed protein product [Adineta ricciae]|uniref:TIR domain-containing protein n=1 Tax=Adineta ricciae TaxID=249248 RepID=A0A814HUK6_ADIRI|nr:unnamed protein product [Adineta ricciae]CAF1416421.1 unnamed protein product [Adineta ricciae]
MDSDKFSALLEGVKNKTTTVVDVCKNYNANNSPPKITDEQFQNELFFTEQFAGELGAILQFWFSDGSLDDDQKETFAACAQFLLKLTQAQSNSHNWLKEQTALIDITEKCINEIASYGYYISVGGTEDPNLESFDWLIQAFEKVRCLQLLPVLVKSVSSRFYTEAMYQLSEKNALELSITQHFLLVTCPNYVLTCGSKKLHCLEIVNRMLAYYEEIYSEFLPHITEWTIPVMLCLMYPIKFILSNIRSLSFEQRKVIYDIILTILLNKSTVDSNIEPVRVSLIHISLCLLTEIIRSDQRIANMVKNTSDKKPELIQVLNNLSKTGKSTQVQSEAIALKSLLITEEEFLQENKAGEVTSVFLQNFNNATEDGNSEQVDEILNGLKVLVQNDDVKKEIIKQNGLPPIIKYAKTTNDNPLPLQITYAMTFNNDAKKVMIEDQEFVDHIKQLRDSEKKDISKVAHGIVWKLEGEEQFKKKSEEKKQEETAEGKKPDAADDGKRPFKNDIMISYCWAQKPLCHKIHDRLETDGYKVWLDRDEMHGSIIERMAEAIEQSQFVLICMSTNYKNSTNCKAEAEYAFNRKSSIVPLIVEPKYKADGWLGFLAGSKIYVDFAEKEAEEFEKAYESLIDELKRNGLGSTGDEDQPKNPTTTPVPEPPKPPEQPEPPPIQTKEYLTHDSAVSWDETHVSEFLIDNKLDQLKHACEGMNGETLLQFYQSCQTAPDKMYPLVNNPKEEHPVSMNTFFKFISTMKKHLPPPAQPKKVYFQYGFIYPPTKDANDQNNQVGQKK